MIILSQKVLPICAPPIDDGAVVVSGKKIADVGPQARILEEYKSECVVDMGDALLMPGLVNLHAHLELSCLKGLTDNGKGFFDWIHSLVALRRSQEFAERAPAGVSAALHEAIESGTSCIGDVCSTDLSIPAILKSGVRAALFLELIGLDPAKAEAAFDALQARLDSLRALPDKIKPGISPHSTYSVSPFIYKLLKDFSYNIGLNIATHLSETIDENLHVQGKPSGLDGYKKTFGWEGFETLRGDSPARALAEYGLGAGWTVAHAVHVDGADIKLLADTGASVAFCPRSNAFLNVGRAPVEDMLAAGVNVGIGTDSLASNLDLDLWEEMRFALLTTRLGPEAIVRMATMGGAKALGFPVGALEVGMDADIIAVETEASNAAEPYMPLVSGTRRGDVLFTMVQGRAIYSRDGYTCNEY